MKEDTFQFTARLKTRCGCTRDIVMVITKGQRATQDIQVALEGCGVNRRVFKFERNISDNPPVLEFMERGIA